MTKEVLIIGGTGMIGRHIDWNLQNKKITTDITTNNKAEVSESDGIFALDLLDTDSIGWLINRGYKAIFNMAGIADTKVCSENPMLADQVIHLGVINLLESIKKLPQKKRPVVILACSVLQLDINSSTTVDINFPLKNSNDPYIKSKNDMYNDALVYLKEGLDIRFAFIANTTGEGQSAGFFPTDMADQIIKGEEVIHGPINHKRPFLHAQDAAEILCYGLASFKSGDKFLVAGEKAIKLSDMLNTMIKISGKNNLPLVVTDRYGRPPKIEEIKFDINPVKSFGYHQSKELPDICKTVLLDRERVSNGAKLPQRGIFGY